MRAAVRDEAGNGFGEGRTVPGREIHADELDVHTPVSIAYVCCSFIVLIILAPASHAV